ncbi:hypothetical protein Afil01_67230 [Actinorhabdospora filicis]|uniref:Uncharacterized protein n=1 Tax=Actinorhabdospora filicis TaxID=1785913 RepID=A0A9W6SSY4_9ACTN|nr:hypothetical protein [Actinorhabdospora filicis]GLZ81916.1 hypothetical protein Afil01_67230 [Actinorhabdospora filicis]
METLVVIVTAEGWDLGVFAAALGASHQVAPASPGSGRHLVVSRPESSARAYVVLMDREGDGLFEDWPEALIPEEPFAAFAIDYRVPALAESIARAILSGTTGLVDTNFGDVLTGEEFLARTGRAGPRRVWWTWPTPEPMPSAGAPASVPRDLGGEIGGPGP